MAKADLIGQAQGLKISLTGEETVAELEALIEKTQGAAPAQPAQPAAAKAADFSWAVNVVKLNRAKAYVGQTQPGLKGQVLEDAVKERYTDLKGLLVQDRPTARKGKNSNVVNLSDNEDD